MKKHLILTLVVLALVLFVSCLSTNSLNYAVRDFCYGL